MTPRPAILHPLTRDSLITADELTASTNGNPRVTVRDLPGDWQAVRFFWPSHANYNAPPSPAYIAIVEIAPDLADLAPGVTIALLAQLAITNRQPTTATE
jgi:hypothetical protein